MIYRSKAPLRIGLAGGGTDLNTYCDRFGGYVLNTSISLYLHCTLEERVDIDSINSMLKAQASGGLSGVIDYTEAPLVSCDFNHDPHSSIVDGTQTRVSDGHLVKLLLWCDNEWGFANRMLDTSLAMGKRI